MTELQFKIKGEKHYNSMYSYFIKNNYQKNSERMCTKNVVIIYRCRDSNYFVLPLISAVLSFLHMEKVFCIWLYITFIIQRENDGQKWNAALSS